MKQTAPKLRPKKKNAIIRFSVLLVAGFVMLNLISLQIEISDKRALLDQIEKQAEVQHIANKEIERQIALGDDKNYIARIARDKLDMGLANERVFRDASGT